MKRQWCKGLLALLLVCSMSACSSTEQESTTEEAKGTVEEKKEETKDEITFEEQTLVDDEYGTFTVKSITDSGDVDLDVTMENKTDVTTMFTVVDVSINGVVEDPYWATEVASGKKANDTITFYSNQLKEDGIEKATNITFTLRMYDTDDWSGDYYIDQSFTLYPYGEDQAELYTRKDKKSDIMIVDNDQIKILIDSVDEDGIYGYTLHLYIENKTDRNLMFSVQNASVNGYMIDPYWAMDVPAGLKAYSDVYWSSSELEENDIEKVETIEMPFTVYDNDNWENGNIFEQTYIYEAK